MFGLSTINQMNRRAAATLRPKHNPKRAKKPVKEMMSATQPDFTPVPPQELLAWLKKSRSNTFSYTNSQCGCLMTRHFKATRHLQNVLVCQRGDLGLDSGKDEGTIILAFGVYPYHDKFWRPFGFLEKLTRAQAIKRLKEIIAEEQL
jgi:hypothetical protein